MNAGAPTAEPMASPGAILAGPTVRIATDVGQGQDELLRAVRAPGSSGLGLRPGRLPDGGHVQPGAVGRHAAGVGPVTIGIAGGITANLEDELPPGIQANLELDGDVAPGAS